MLTGGGGDGEGDQPDGVGGGSDGEGEQPDGVDGDGDEEEQGRRAATATRRSRGRRGRSG